MTPQDVIQKGRAKKRIQRQRIKGWRMPEGAVYVGRPSRWANPFKVSSAIEWGFAKDEREGRVVSVAAFRNWVSGGEDWWMGPESREARARITDALGSLRGKDLACWCPLDQPCHADVLLELLA